MHPLAPRSRPGQLSLAYAVIATVFLAMDAVWLVSMNAALYRPALGHLMAPAVDWPAAVLFYALYVAGLVFFAALPARRPMGALGRGVFLGLLAYGTYDLTNQATLRDWPWRVTLVDLAWGGTVSGVAACAGAAVLRLTSRRGRRGRGR
jgi:uncharacterized membrane protein